MKKSILLIATTLVCTMSNAAPCFSNNELNKLKEITSIVTKYYRDNEYFVARAYLPQQTIKDGIIEIAIIASCIAMLARPEKRQPPGCGRTGRRAAVFPSAKHGRKNHRLCAQNHSP